MPKRAIAGSYGIACVSFFKTAKLFCRVAIPFYIPTNSKWSDFLTSLPASGVIPLFCFGFFSAILIDKCCAISCGFVFALWLVMSSVFVCL